MVIFDLLKGKEVIYKTDALIDVTLVIESVKDSSYSVDLEPATRENDWWPRSETRNQYTVKFTNGFVKTYNSLNEIKLKDEYNI